jgi:hypothetical protein
LQQFSAIWRHPPLTGVLNIDKWQRFTHLNYQMWPLVASWSKILREWTKQVSKVAGKNSNEAQIKQYSAYMRFKRSQCLTASKPPELSVQSVKSTYSGTNLWEIEGGPYR